LVKKKIENYTSENNEDKEKYENREKEEKVKSGKKEIIFGWAKYYQQNQLQKPFKNKKKKKKKWKFLITILLPEILY